VALEATNWYWFPLYQALRQDPELAPGPDVLSSNPGNRPLQGQLSDKDKSDDADAYIVADRLRTYNARIAAPFAPDLRYLGLRS